jgi:hypothetical protein
MPDILHVTVPNGTAAPVWSSRNPGVSSLLFINPDLNNYVYIGSSSNITPTSPNVIPLPPNGTFSGDANANWYVTGAAAGIQPLVVVPNGQAFFLGLTQGLGNLAIPSVQSPNFALTPTPVGWQIQKNGDATFADLTVYGAVIAEGTQIDFPGGGFISESTNPWITIGGDPVQILTPLASALDQLEPGTTNTPETWHSLGTAGATGCTLLQARYRLAPDGQHTEIDIALEAGAGGSTAGTYTWTNTLPAVYQFPGSFLRNYPFPFNANITTATENSVIVVDGSTATVPGRVRMTIPAVAANVYFTGTCLIPLS